MTEAGAIKFLRFCEKSWLRARNLSATQVIAKSRQSFFVLACNGLVVFGMTIPVFHYHETGFWYDYGIFMMIVGSLLFALGSMMLIRLRTACRVLNQAANGSSRLSGTR